MLEIGKCVRNKTSQNYLIPVSPGVMPLGSIYNISFTLCGYSYFCSLYLDFYLSNSNATHRS